MKKNIVGLLFLSILILSNNAQAVGSVSRACRFDKIPPNAQHLASQFFFAIGADADVLLLPLQGPYTQTQYWVLESLTTDYGNVRYYLFATRLLYEWEQIQPGSNGSGAILGHVFKSRLDSNWTNEQISSAMKADSDFAPYYLNRQLLYSARAGSPKIIEKLGSYESHHYLVLGRHWYFDASSGTVTRVGDSQADDCNLTNFGIMDR